ncbi:MAG: sulfatase-like hydrolase/transferase [Myxococcota bacterium]|nr:sulfatase-like hydrolase/transferase [Myxococcota bacterium]
MRPALLLLSACAGAPAPSLDDRGVDAPSVLLVVLDTVRADRLQAWGHDRPTGLQLTALAESGVRWAEAHAPGAWTWPVHASLFTGEPPWVHGAHFPPLGVAMEGGFPAPRDDLPTLAERFASAGYETVSLSANCLLEPGMGLTRGFEDARCLDIPGAVEAAAEAAVQGQDRPLFLFVNLMPAHGPYSLTPVPWSARHAERLTAPEKRLAPYIDPGPPPGVDLQRRAEPRAPTGVQQVLSGSLQLDDDQWEMVHDLYDGEVVDADRRLLRVVQAWNAAGRGGIVAVTSDHGEHLGERGLVDHRGSVWPGLTHVPLVIAAPGRLPAGAVVERPVSLVDLPDTLLTLAGVSGASGPGLLQADGRVDPAPPRPVMAMAWPDPYRAAVVGGRWTRTWQMWTDGQDRLVMDDAGGVQRFAADDARMLRDIAGDDPAATAALAARAQRDFGAPAFTGTPRAADEETQSQLEALGYLQGTGGRTHPSSAATGENPH